MLSAEKLKWGGIYGAMGVKRRWKEGLTHRNSCVKIHIETCCLTTHSKKQ